jgi:hypothetical protein
MKKTYLLLLLCAVFCLVGCDNKQLTARYTAKFDKYIAKHDFEGARKCATKFPYNRDRKAKLSAANVAEFNYLIDQNSLNDAYYLAIELNAKRDLMTAISNNLLKLLNAGQAQILVTLLSSWTFTEEYHPELDYYSHGSGPIKYNTEVKEYNDLLDGILNYALFNEDNGLAKKAIRLYRPYVRPVMKNGKWQSNKLVNEAKDAAVAKTKESGIQL